MAKDKRMFLPSYYVSPGRWGPHPRKHMLMTPWLVFFGSIFAFAVPTLMGAFWQMMFFNPPLSNNFAPLTASASRGRVVYLQNECYVCHSSFVRPQDVRQGMYFTYPRVSHPGDFITSDDSPNVFGDERYGPDLSQESGFHPPDWEIAHFNDPRYVDPLSAMPRFNFLSDQQVNDLVAFVETRSGKVGLVREAGQEWAKKVFLIAGDGNGAPKFDYPRGYAGAKLSLSDVAVQALGGPSGPSATVDGLPFPDVLSINMAERGYWLMDDPLPVTKNNLFRGRWVFQTFCIGCHGRGGSAITEAAKFMAPRPIDFTHYDDAANGNDTSPGIYYYRILRGWMGSAMEEFGTRLSVDDIWRVVLFLKTISNGTLQESTVPTPETYVQWHPTPQLLQYVKKHPIQDAREYTGKQTGTQMLDSTGTGVTDPFIAESIRVFPGLRFDEKIMMPGYGEISHTANAVALKAIYDTYLDQGWLDYAARGGRPILPASQKSIPPEVFTELR